MSPRSALRESAPAAAPAAPSVPASAAIALCLQAAVMEAADLRQAAQAAVRLLAERLPAARVSIAMAQPDGSLRLLAASDGRALGAASPFDEALLAALAEAFDQQITVVWPGLANAPAHALPAIDIAARALREASGGAVVSLPLVARGERVGALCLEWESAEACDRLDAALPEHLAAWLAPALALMQAVERPWHRRLADDASRWLQADDVPHRRRWRALWPLGVAALALLAVWPATREVGGAARVEGAQQRVMSAPADGFIQQVHVRPGQAVRAGQPLMDLADRDLQLERQRWQSQLAQQQEGLAAAQARADRAALALHQARADEAQAQLDLTEEKLARSRLLAPFDGIVVQGDWAQQLGVPVKQGAELMTLAPQGAFRVIVEVDERDLGLLEPGQTGSLALSALPWETLPLDVLRIAPMSRASGGRNVFEVEAGLRQPPAGLQPGWLGQGRIEVGHQPLLWQWGGRIAAALRQALWRWGA